MIAKIRLEIFDVTGLPDGELGEDLIFNQIYPSSPRALRIELPLKLLIWQDETGAVSVSYDDPVRIFERHQISDPGQSDVLERMQGALQ